MGDKTRSAEIAVVANQPPYSASHAVRLQHWLDQARAKHGDFFDYESAATEFQNMATRVHLVCQEHGPFTITASAHIASSSGGCHKCAVANRIQGRSSSKKDEFLKLFATNYADRLEIVSPWTGMGGLMDFRCKIHGTIKKTRPGHLKHSGVLACNACSFDEVGRPFHRLEKLVESGAKGRATWLGVMEVEVFGIRSLKVGVTSSSLTKRYKWYLQAVYFSVRVSELDALVIENQVHRAFKAGSDRRIMLAGMRGGSRWPGDTECYSLKQRKRIVAFIRKRVDALRTVTPDYWAEYQLYEGPNCEERDTSRLRNARSDPKGVVCIETGIKYASIKQAMEATGLHHIGEVCDGQRRLAGGFRWAYIGAYIEDRVADVRPKKTTGKPVRCVETGEIFASAKAAAEATGVARTKITSVCTGHRRTAGSYQWVYESEVHTTGIRPLRAKVRRTKARSVRCIDTGRVYRTQGDAMKETGIKQSSISQVVNGHSERAGGYRWEFVE